METIKRQTRAANGWLVVGQSVSAGFAYGLLVVRLLCLWHEQRHCSCCMRLVALHKCYMPSPLPNVIMNGRNGTTCDKPVWQLQSKLVQTVQQHCLVWIYLDT